MQKRKISSKWMFALPALLVFMILAGAVSAQPALPCSFYGTASINGRPVPAGSVITAQIDGISRGSIVISKDGNYGGKTLADSDKKLDVFEGNNGDEIIFYVQTPAMSNRLQAEQTGTWQAGDTPKLDLTFAGKEIPRSEPAASQGTQGGGTGSTASGGTGSTASGGSSQEGSDTVIQPSALDFQNAGHVYEITANLSSGNVSLVLAKGDEVKFAYSGSDVSVKVKSMSDFAVLFTVTGNDIVIGEKGSSLVDINGDGFSELQIAVGKVNDNKAEVTFALLVKPVATSGQGITGLVISDGNGLWISISAIVIIAVLGGGIYLFKKRGVRNEGYQGYSK